MVSIAQGVEHAVRKIGLPVVVAEDTAKCWQYPHGIHCLVPALCMREVAGPFGIGCAVQPVELAADIDAGLIDMEHR